MKKAFMCSLCRNGLLGGGLYLDEQVVTYKTQKLTVSESYKNLVLPLQEIEALSWRRVIPIASFSMTNGECYQFLIFNKRRFDRCFQQVRKA